MKRALTIAAAGYLGGLVTAAALLRVALHKASPSPHDLRAPDEREVKQVLAVEAARVKALLEADIGTLDRITAQDYVHVESNGRHRSKSEFLDGLARAEYRFENFVIDENRVRIVGPVAIVTGRYHNDIRTREGLQPTKHARHIRVYVKRAGVWQNVAHQATQVQRHAS